MNYKSIDFFINYKQIKTTTKITMMMKNFAFALIATYCVAIKITVNQDGADELVKTEELVKEENRLHDAFLKIDDLLSDGKVDATAMNGYADDIDSFAKAVRVEVTKILSAPSADSDEDDEDDEE